MARSVDTKASSLRRLLGRPEARDVAPLASLAVLVVFFTIAASNFLSPDTLTMILKRGAVLAIVSVGLTYVLLCAEIDLAVGAMALWSACFCGWLFDNWALPAGRDGVGSPWMIPVVILLPLLSCFFLGLLCGALTVWSRLPSFIISLAMMFIAEGLAKYLTRGETLAVPKLLDTIGNEGIELDKLLLRIPSLLHRYTGIEPARFFGEYKIPYSAILAVVVFLLGHFVLRYTRFGRYIYATGGNRQAARLAGIRTGWIVVACLAICAVTAGLGGILNAGRMTNVTLDQNKDLLLSAVACVVLGGTSLFGGEGNMGKTVIGVLTFTVLRVGLMRITWIDNLARDLLTGVVLMVALVINGVLAKKE